MSKNAIGTISKSFGLLDPQIDVIETIQEKYAMGNSEAMRYIIDWARDKGILDELESVRLHSVRKEGRG